MMASLPHQAPLYIQHPFHPSLTLTLVPETPSHVPVFCNACNFQIRGFRCSCGSFNLHPYCAGIPRTLYIHHPYHPYSSHPLTLMFCPPYSSGQFTCNLCGCLGGYHWLYRCTICNNFNAHLGCAVYAAQFRPHPYMSTYYSNLPYNGGTSHSSGAPSSSFNLENIGRWMWAAPQLANLAFGGLPFVDNDPTFLDWVQQLTQGFLS